jgi:hypothetical protein
MARDYDEVSTVSADLKKDGMAAKKKGHICQ